MTFSSTARNQARRPRRPGDVRHDGVAVDPAAMLDDVPAPARAGAVDPTPVVCQEVLLLRARTDCPHCGQRTAVFAMMGLPEFEIDNAPTTLLRRLSALPPVIDKAVRDFGRGHWRRDLSQQARGAHWHSHCERCHARIGETFTLGADGPFRPALYRQRHAIRSKRLSGPFVLDGAQRQVSAPLLAWLEWQRQREARAAD
jgi:hypothetical protein